MAVYRWYSGSPSSEIPALGKSGRSEHDHGHQGPPCDLEYDMNLSHDATCSARRYRRDVRQVAHELTSRSTSRILTHQNRVARSRGLHISEHPGDRCARLGAVEGDTGEPVEEGHVGGNLARLGQFEFSSQVLDLHDLVVIHMEAMDGRDWQLPREWDHAELDRCQGG